MGGQKLSSVCAPNLGRITMFQDQDEQETARPIQVSNHSGGGGSSMVQPEGCGVQSIVDKFFASQHFPFCTPTMKDQKAITHGQNVMDTMNGDEVIEHIRGMKKLDRARIQEQIEQTVLDSLSHLGYSVRVLLASDCKDLDNFENVNDLIDLELGPEMLKNQVKLIDLESAEFYRTLILSKDDKPVATGSINITQTVNASTVKQTAEEQEETTNITEMSDPFDQQRSVIQYMMIDKEIINSSELDVTINKMLQALEVISYLYSCQKVQLEVSIVPQEYLYTQDFWLIYRNRMYYYCKNREQSLRVISEWTKQLIEQSNVESNQFAMEYSFRND